MLLTFALGTLATFAPLQGTDTTVTVERGQRLAVDAFSGDVTVRTWARSAVRVQGSSSERTRIEVSTSPTEVRVRTSGRRGPPQAVDLEITAPAWMALSVSGVQTEVVAEGIQAPISVETVEGDVTVRGGAGNVSLQSVQGSVTLRDAKGRITIESVNEDVSVTNTSGEVSAETVNGDVTLTRVDASSAAASTVNGDIVYDGPIRNGGRYHFTTHNGDVDVTIPEGASAAVSVSTFSGEFESDFPVTIRETKKGKQFSFTLGAGSAQVELESFQGTIHLYRPGGIRARQSSRHDDHD